jgi:hypothetical protein
MKSYHICLTRRVSCTYIMICGLISFSQFMDNYSLCLILNFFFSILHYQQMILNRFNNSLLMSSVLFLFFFFTHTILFLFYYSISIGMNRTCRCKKRTFSFMRGFSSVFTAEKICFKRDEKSKFFCCFS